MDSVLEVRSGLVVLKRGAERSVVLVSSGILGYALDKAKVTAPVASATLQNLCVAAMPVLNASCMHHLPSALSGALPRFQSE